MSGIVLHRGDVHYCRPPQSDGWPTRTAPMTKAEVGTIWRCECGQHWKVQPTFSGFWDVWHAISPRRARRLLNRIAAGESRSSAGESK